MNGKWLAGTSKNKKMKLQTYFRAGLLTVSLLIMNTITSQTRGTIADHRDGKIYKTIKIGGVEWMAENLNFTNSNSWCYENKPANCEASGRLYSYVGAVQACPSGWRLPAMSDWENLINMVGRDSAALALSVEGTMGFNVIYAGVRYDYGGFNHLNDHAYFWSLVFDRNEPAWVYHFGRRLFTVSRIQSFSGNGFSVRCVRR